MTICLAALYGDGEGAILVSDKMRTLEHPLATNKARHEDESFVKMKKLTDNAYVQSAGKMDICVPYLRELENSVKASDKTDRVLKVAAAIYRKYREQYVVDTILLHYGYTSVKAYRSDKDLSPTIAAEISHRISNCYSPFDLVIVGLDAGGKYKVYGLSDPGFFQEQAFGSTAVGSGVKYTLDIMVQHLQGADKKTVRDIVVKAKKAAEEDDFVGEQTDIIEIPL